MKPRENFNLKEGILCNEPPIEMITVQRPMAYHNSKQVYEPRLEPVMVTNLHSVSELQELY